MTTILMLLTNRIPALEIIGHIWVKPMQTSIQPFNAVLATFPKLDPSRPSFSLCRLSINCSFPIVPQPLGKCTTFSWRIFGVRESVIVPFWMWPRFLTCPGELWVFRPVPKVWWPIEIIPIDCQKLFCVNLSWTPDIYVSDFIRSFTTHIFRMVLRMRRDHQERNPAIRKRYQWVGRWNCNFFNARSTHYARMDWEGRPWKSRWWNRDSCYFQECQMYPCDWKRGSLQPVVRGEVVWSISVSDVIANDILTANTTNYSTNSFFEWNSSFLDAS